MVRRKRRGCGCLMMVLAFGVWFAIKAVQTANEAQRGEQVDHHDAQDENSSTSGAASMPKWYEGGTLHKKSALEWQTASKADKLATCGDFVTGMWKNGDLKPAIANRLSTVDDVRPYAQELVDFLDTALKIDPDPEQNRMMFTNQTVSSTAAIGMVMMGWTE
jgi:hypothetical protein